MRYVANFLTLIVVNRREGGHQVRRTREAGESCELIEPLLVLSVLTPEKTASYTRPVQRGDLSLQTRERMLEQVRDLGLTVESQGRMLGHAHDMLLGQAGSMVGDAENNAVQET